MLPRTLAPLAFLSLLALAAPPALADTVSVTLAGSYIQSVTAGGVTTPAHDLENGVSSGEASFTESTGFAVRAADEPNLAFYFARGGNVPPEWEVDLGTWTDRNGDAADFFVFEAGGNDALLVAPRFPNGTYGQETIVSGWTSTGYASSMGPNAGQVIYGLSFKCTDLLRANGAPVQLGDVLAGVRMRSSTLDGAAFLAVDPLPDPGWGQDGDGSTSVHGTLAAGQPLEIAYQGPWATELDNAPNPFLDYRLNVTFHGPGGRTYVVPGFFDGNGQGGGAGHVWRVRFTPEVPGNWNAVASFRTGTELAISTAAGAGSAVALLNGATVQIAVGAVDPQAPGFLKWGRLEYANGHYPKFTSGPYFIKGGVNGPENLLAYRGFNDVGKGGGIGRLHSYSPHRADWFPGDPEFQSTVHAADGRGFAGALNYLSLQGVNSIFTMLMNLGGDGQDVHPFVGPENTSFNKRHYDIGRLHQWNLAFEHATRVGIALHFGLAETEPANESWLDGGQLGTERKLFYREVVARFAHNAAVKWTLSEENDYSVPNLRSFADYIREVDPYDHPVTFHNHPNDFSDYQQVAGEARFSATSLQYDPDLIGSQVESMRSLSASAGHPWIVDADENNPWQTGLTDTNADDLRKRVLYDVLFSGGHIEWYLGWFDLPLGGDLTLEDFRTRQPMWEAMSSARRFMETRLPFWEMQPADGLLTGESSAYGGGEVFAKPGSVYAVYLPSATGSPVLDLSAAPGPVRLRWFDPRNGTFQGGVQSRQGGGALALGAPPYQPGEDWVVLIDKPGDFTGDVGSLSVSSGGSQVLTLDAGVQNANRTYWILGSNSGTSPGFRLGTVPLPLNLDRYTRFTFRLGGSNPMLQGFRGTLDSNGRATAVFTAPPGFLTGLTGTSLHHAYVLVQPFSYASQPVELRLLP